MQSIAPPQERGRKTCLIIGNLLGREIDMREANRPEDLSGTMGRHPKQSEKRKLPKENKQR